MMACDNWYEFVDRDVGVQSPASAILVMRSIDELVTGIQDAITGGATCGQILAVIPFYITQFNLPQVGYVENGTVLDLSTFQVGPGESYIGTYEQNITLTIDGVDYGFWHCKFEADGTLISVDNLTTYGPTVQFGGVGGVGEMELTSGPQVQGYWFPAQHPLSNITDHQLWLACIVPACGISPPSPFPPFLPPTVNWPNITAAPTPPTASIPSGQPANQVLAIASNYSVFSNFGYKG